MLERLDLGKVNFFDLVRRYPGGWIRIKTIDYIYTSIYLTYLVSALILQPIATIAAKLAIHSISYLHS